MASRRTTFPSARTRAGHTRCTSRQSGSARSWTTRECCSLFPLEAVGTNAFAFSYVSAFFLWKLRDNAFNSGRGANSGPDSLARRLKTLFWIAATNFVFPGALPRHRFPSAVRCLQTFPPVLFDIVQMAIFYHYPFFTSAYVTIASIYVSIIGVVFATVWGSSSARQAHPSNLASLGSVPGHSVNQYTFKSALSPPKPESAGSTSDITSAPPSGGYAGSYGAREKGPTWYPENGRGPAQSDIPLDIRIKQTQEREVV